MASSLRGGARALRRFPVLYGLAWALFYAVIGVLVVTLWAHVWPLSTRQLSTAAYIVHCIAVLLGSIAGSRAAGERGWYYGGVIGLIYALVMMCIGFVVYSTFSFDAGGLLRILLMALIGAFGGMIGVNTGSSRI